MKLPCSECENKGCGAYHDKCEEYQAYKEERKKITKKLTDKAIMEGWKKDGQLRVYKKKRNRK